jgi:protein-tyrosine phosphatase
MHNPGPFCMGLAPHAALFLKVDMASSLRYNESHLKGDTHMSVILFVCTGNICRSPMAVGLLRQRLSQEGLASQFKVFSAGVWALDNHPASDKAIAVMAERGIDINDHIAHTITYDDIAEAELILVMSREHADVIRNTWPQYAWKVHRLSEMVGKRKDIQDPYGSTVTAYRACADTLSTYIEEGLERILELT